MKALFVDTSFYLAFISTDDAHHVCAMSLAGERPAPMVTTAWVLTEVGNMLSAPPKRRTFLTLIRDLRANPHVTVVQPTQELFDQGLDLYAQRPDKDWSLTDCISFVVMQQQGLTEALTGDRHFEQAGFKALLLG